MKRKKSLSLLILASFSFFLFSPAASAEELVQEHNLTDEQIGNIATNCPSIKESLKRVQNSDRNTRVSIGRTYQSILTNFITPLNVRLVKNNRSDSELNNIQSKFSDARDAFTHDYVSYSQDLEALIAIDCKATPVDFYHQLEKTRSSRQKIASDISSINFIISDHVKAVTDLRNSLKGVIE